LNILPANHIPGQESDNSLIDNELRDVFSGQEYDKRVKEWDRKFNLLVDKGGMPQSQYDVSRHYYGLGVFDLRYS
jgi:hypothetical protein